MPNYTTLAFQGIISTFIGIAVTFLVVSISQYRISIFWLLLLLLWLLIACLNGYIVKSKIEPVIFSLFLFLFSFVSVFFFSLLISSFSIVLLEAFQLDVGDINQWGNIQQAFVITLIISLIIFAIQILGSYSVFLIKNYIQKSKSLSADIIEQQAFKKYEIPSDSGSYTQRSDDFE